MNTRFVRYAIGAVAGWSLIACQLAHADDIDEKVRRMLDTPEARELMLHQARSMMEPVMKLVVKSNDRITPEVGEWILSVTINAFEERVHEVFALFVPIYRKHFTDEEISELARFHSSPAGLKASQLQAVISREAEVIGAKWGKKVGEEAVREALEARRRPSLLGQVGQWHTWSLGALPKP